MSEMKGAMSALKEVDSALNGSEPRLDIRVTRHGDSSKKELCFRVEDFGITDAMQVYNIRHVLGFEQMIEQPIEFGSGSDVLVTFHYWQLIDELLVKRLAKSIGDALGFAPGHITVTIDDNVLL
jgi:hypothetical protein